MVAEIADFDKQFYIDPRKKHNETKVSHNNFVLYQKLASEV